LLGEEKEKGHVRRREKGLPSRIFRKKKTSCIIFQKRRLGALIAKGRGGKSGVKAKAVVGVKIVLLPKHRTLPYGKK